MPRPSVLGFNIGVDSGEAAGQTVMRCHVHLIPRRKGDTEDPRGGVRGVIPGRMMYPDHLKATPLTSGEMAPEERLCYLPAPDTTTGMKSARVWPRTSSLPA
ncbi:MAG: HIT domain-containing protein [Bacteroidota bacterium]